MVSKQLAPGGKAISILAVASILIIGCYLINGLHQSEADCSLAESYNSDTQKCILKTGKQYADELAEADNAKITAETEKKRRSGVVCIPAAEAHNYIGVDGCVRMVVNHYYIESYGWAWLNAGNTKSDFTVAALQKGIITKSDAEYYLGKIVSVRGTIESYQGTPEIKISNKNAIFDIETQEEYASQIQEMTHDITTNTQCNSLENARKQCKWAKDNGLGNAGYCSMYNLLQRQAGDKCKDYIPKESTSDKQAKCFDEKIKTANNKFQKDAVYRQCQKP